MPKLQIDSHGHSPWSSLSSLRGDEAEASPTTRSRGPRLLEIDFLVIMPILVLGSLSLLVIYSLDKTLAANQLLFWAIGALAFFLAANIRVEFWQKYSIHIYLVCVLLLVAVLTAGEEIRGANRWINLGSLHLQPSEIAKIATIILLATFYAGRSTVNLLTHLISFALVLPPFVLIVAQPDIGSAAALITIWLVISFISGLRYRHLILLMVTAIFILPISYNLLAPYQKERLTTYLNPQGDPLGAGYNIIQSKIAVGSGQLFGRGPGQGFQSQLKFLPEAESDFIFAATVEQLGFLGGAVIIGSFSLLLFRIIASLQAAGRFRTMLTAGIIALLAYQTTVNIGMNMGLVPVTGITLPLVSYGGSSLVSTLFLLGLVLSIRR